MKERGSRSERGWKRKTVYNRESMRAEREKKEEREMVIVCFIEYVYE